MLKAFLEIGLPTVSPLRPVFINHTRHLLAMDPILPADRCVMEVLEDVAADPETLEALRRLKKLNYRIALDDFVYSDELVPMIELADYVKLDLQALGREPISGTCRPAAPLRVRHCRGKDRIRGRVPLVHANWVACSSRATTCAVRKWSPAAAFLPTVSRCSPFSANAPTWKVPPA